MHEEKTAIRSHHIVSEQEVIDGYVLISNGSIEGIEAGEIPCSFQGTILKRHTYWVVPGFIDLHIHGLGGWAVESEARDLYELTIQLTRVGVTAFLPAIAPLSHVELEHVLEAIQEVRYRQEQGGQGARILGVHLEGPFVNPQKKGALNPAYLLQPSLSYIKTVEQKAAGLLRRVTVAPELEGALEIVAYLHGRGCQVAAGHTQATYDEARKGIEAGITIANHLFNAMPPIHHRQPGAVGAFLEDDRVICEVIGDGIHIHPAIIQLIMRCKGEEGLYMISDSISAAGLSPGTYTFSGQTITVDAKGYSYLNNGTLAGSTVTIPQCYTFLLQELGIHPLQAVNLTASIPARVMGVSPVIGSLEVGKEADIVLLQEGTGRVVETFIKGNVQHSTLS